MATLTLENKYRTNLWKIKWSGFFAAFRIFVAIQYIYFQQNGLSFAEIGLIVGAFFVGTFIFEVPSGVFADYFGRKTSIAVSAVLFILSFLIFGLGRSFITFLIANFLQGVAEAFTSGSDEALIYDSLKEIKEEEKFSKYFGAKWSYFMYGTGLSSIVASLVSGFDLRLTFLLSIAGAVLSLFFALSITEPPLTKQQAEKNYFKHLKDSAQYLLTHPALKFLFIYVVVVNLSIQIYFQYIQFMLKDTKIPIEYFGFIYAFFLAYCGFSSQISHKLEKPITKKNTLILIVALLASALLVLNFGLNLITVTISILLVEFLFGFIGPILNNYFHKYVDSHNRATMSSLRSFGTGVSVAVLAPLFGKIADWYSYPSMFLVLGAMMLFFTIPVLLRFVRAED